MLKTLHIAIRLYWVHDGDLVGFYELDPKAFQIAAKRALIAYAKRNTEFFIKTPDNIKIRSKKNYVIKISLNSDNSDEKMAIETIGMFVAGTRNSVIKNIIRMYLNKPIFSAYVTEGIPFTIERKALSPISKEKNQGTITGDNREDVPFDKSIQKPLDNSDNLPAQMQLDAYLKSLNEHSMESRSQIQKLEPQMVETKQEKGVPIDARAIDKDIRKEQSKEYENNIFTETKKGQSSLDDMEDDDDFGSGIFGWADQIID